MQPARQRVAELDRLERDIHGLRVEYERFLNGDLDIPPDELSERVRRQILHLQGSLKTAVETFRLSSLEARFHSYSELYNRRVRERESSSSRRPARETAAPSGDVVIGEVFDPRGVVPLYQRLYRQRGARSVDLSSFTDYLERQHHLIRERTGCSRVRFLVVEEDGKNKLKARPLREGS